MKTITLCSLTSLAGLVAFAAGLAFNLGALPLFAAAVAALVLLTWVHDYQPRRDYAAGTTIALRPTQALPLAA
ncbi:MAG: hypothetical protein HZC55_17670 [Verrucomicrobia bacterium]|nr:hypothetical protein [Verrucomicrobiota bacterium]